MPIYSNYVPNALNEKTTETYMYFTKPYTPWKLSCDSGDTSRAEVINWVDMVQNSPQGTH
jgi:hypothetical protein